MARGFHAPAASPPSYHSPAARGRVAIVVSPSMLHIIGVPLLLLGCIGVGFVIVFLRTVLLPFVVSVFIVYLLRPLVNALTTPFNRVRARTRPGCAARRWVGTVAVSSGGVRR